MAGMDSSEFVSRGGYAPSGGYNTQNMMGSGLPRPKETLEENAPGGGIIHYTVA